MAYTPSTHLLCHADVSEPVILAPYPRLLGSSFLSPAITLLLRPAQRSQPTILFGRIMNFLMKLRKTEALGSLEASVTFPCHHPQPCLLTWLLLAQLKI